MGTVINKCKINSLKEAFKRNLVKVGTLSHLGERDSDQSDIRPNLKITFPELSEACKKALMGSKEAYSKFNNNAPKLIKIRVLVTIYQNVQKLGTFWSIAR